MPFGGKICQGRRKTGGKCERKRRKWNKEKIKVEDGKQNGTYNRRRCREIAKKGVHAKK